MTIETLITFLTIENLNSWQSLLPDNQDWHWTAFAILAMFWFWHWHIFFGSFLRFNIDTFFLAPQVDSMKAGAPTPPLLRTQLEELTMFSEAHARCSFVQNKIVWLLTFSTTAGMWLKQPGLLEELKYDGEKMNLSFAVNRAVPASLF